MKKISCVLGIAIGVTAVILAIICFSMFTGTIISSETYGGDAYTGIQNAAARAANNTYYLANIVKFASGSILLILGLFSIAFFSMKIFDRADHTIIASAPNDNQEIDELPDL